MCARLYEHVANTCLYGQELAAGVLPPPFRCCCCCPSGRMQAASHPDSRLLRVSAECQRGVEYQNAPVLKKIAFSFVKHKRKVYLCRRNEFVMHSLQNETT